ncbi:MAG: ABC transporter ATP-binding protein [Bacteroidota bacterium]|jgi:lipoprotein-releasing system ATP-binding protein
MLQAVDIKKQYDQSIILKGVSLSVQPAEMVAIMGPSGAGKSTLLHILGTLDTADAGSISINNTAVHALSKNEMADFRNQSIGFVFQFHHLLPEFNALENICLPQWIAKKDKAQAERYALELLDYMNLTDKAHKKPNELSGGEQQRIAIARALINKPAIVFADEPTGNLDSHNAQSIHELFSKLRTELQQTFVIVTHNEHLAKSTDRVIKMQDGLIIA